MSIESLFLIVLFLGFVLGVLCTQLLRYAADYARHLSLSRERAMRAHPSNHGRPGYDPKGLGSGGNLHVGTIHVPRSRAPRNDWFDRYLRGEYEIEDEPLPITVPAQRRPDSQSNWEFPMECSE